MICTECRYSGLWGGMAITYSNCKECGKEIVNANTATDDYCVECADRLGICQHCGKEIAEFSEH